MTRPLNWDTDGRFWPHRACSRFVRAAGLRWHVQVMGEGPPILLLHGTGASTHSWRGTAPLLARRGMVIVPDLPGHGFTGTPEGFSLPGVASGVAALLRVMGVSPVLVAGHSAGAAIAARLCLDGAIEPDAVLSVNGALLPFPGMTNEIFGATARFLARSQMVSRAFALVAGAPSSVDRMLRSTGSRIDADGARLYRILAANPVHVAGALGWMANWDLHALARDLPRLTARLILVAGSNDGMVPASETSRVRALVPGAETVWLDGLGHLAHEERPEAIAALMERLLVHEPAV